MFLCVVPFDVDARKCLAIPISCDGVVFLSHTLEMLYMFISDIFNAKIFDDEDKHDWPLFVFPEAGSGSCFVVAFFVESGAKEII